MVNESICSGCAICALVCPAEAITIEDHMAHVNEQHCDGCQSCFSRCPTYAIEMTARSMPIRRYVEVKDFDQEKIKEICEIAHMHPKQVACQCTETRAEEVVAAILKGAKSPTDITRMTGVRSGCKQLCVQPMTRLLEAAGVKVEANGWRTYTGTPTIWDVPEHVKRKYRTYRFDDDLRLINRIICSDEA